MSRAAFPCHLLEANLDSPRLARAITGYLVETRT